MKQIWVLILMFSVCAAFDTTMGTAHAVQDIDLLSQLESDEYRDMRNELLKRRSSSNVEKALERSWQAGLTAYILAEWVQKQATFARWDNVQPIRKRGSGYGQHPAIAAGPKAQTYLVEQVWKTARTPEWRNDALNALFRLSIQGPKTFWKAVWEGAAEIELRAVAIHALVGDESSWARNLLVGVLEDIEEPALIKMAALSGLGIEKPAFATTVILETMTVWQDNPLLLSYGFKALAQQVEPSARATLHEYALDPAANDEIRTAAIGAFSSEPREEDIVVLEALAVEAVPDKIKYRAISALKKYEYLGF